MRKYAIPIAKIMFFIQSLLHPLLQDELSRKVLLLGARYWVGAKRASKRPRAPSTQRRARSAQWSGLLRSARNDDSVIFDINH
jgi:hypothetical protein